jgi:hypothetical protein
MLVGEETGCLSSTAQTCTQKSKPFLLLPGLYFRQDLLSRPPPAFLGRQLDVRKGNDTPGFPEEGSYCRPACSYPLFWIKNVLRTEISWLCLLKWYSSCIWAFASLHGAQQADDNTCLSPIRDAGWHTHRFILLKSDLASLSPYISESQN